MASQNAEYLTIKGMVTTTGILDCSTNPNFPTAEAGYNYYISVGGKIGGASGKSVFVGDFAMCRVYTSPTGDYATVGSNWDLIQHPLSEARLEEIYLMINTAQVTYQSLNANLTSVSSLATATSSFVKMASFGVFSLDSTTYQVLNGNLTAVSSLATATTGFVKMASVGVFTTDVSNYQTLNSNLTSVSSLATASTGFVKMASVGVLSVDTVNYFPYSVTAVGDGTYTLGIGATQNGTITITSGVITAIQQVI